MIDYAKFVRARLNDFGTVAKDEYGKDVYVDIFSNEQITTYLEASLLRVNVLFKKGFLTLHEKEVFDFADLIIQGAVITALASKALLERGREFAINDGVVSYAPPSVSATLMAQWEIESNDYRSKVNFLFDQHCYT